jgi:phospholipid/cholesterol/gamma-HCH transport system substrate-binding protein
MKNNYFEIIVGTFVLFCTIYFFAFSYKKINNTASDTYQIVANFDSVDGVDSGTNVKISDVKIGSVNSQALDKETYRAKLMINIDSNIKLPKDSSVKIVSSGLLGGKYLSVDPGAEDDMLQNGDELKYTQSAVNFEELLGKFIFGNKDNKDKEKEQNEAK